MTRTGEREIRFVSGGLPDNPGELTDELLCYFYMCLQLVPLPHLSKVYVGICAVNVCTGMINRRGEAEWAIDPWPVRAKVLIALVSSN